MTEHKKIEHQIDCTWHGQNTETVYYYIHVCTYYFTSQNQMQHFKDQLFFLLFLIRTVHVVEKIDYISIFYTLLTAGYQACLET
jgi:hypothetical protein